MKTGRPKIEVDFAEVDKLCQIQCTGEEIASFFEISYDTLERRCKEQFKVSFAEYIKEKSAKGKSSLRRLQWKAAMNGNVTMLIWLGKQYLGQSDKTESNVAVTEDGICISFVDKTKRTTEKEKDPKIAGDYTNPTNIEEV